MVNAVLQHPIRGNNCFLVFIQLVATLRGLGRFTKRRYLRLLEGGSARAPAANSTPALGGAWLKGHVRETWRRSGASKQTLEAILHKAQIPYADNIVNVCVNHLLGDFQHHVHVLLRQSI